MRINQQGGLRPPGPRAQGAEPLGEKNLMKLVSGLADGFPERTFGTRQAEKAARWMAKELAGAGCRPIEGSFVHHFDWPMGEETWRGHNVAGVIEGADPKLKDEYIVVTAHHDSQQDTKAGANDNASGCAAVIALAQELAKNPPQRSVLFMTFDGEEGLRIDGKYHGGRRGSQAYAENPLVPLDKTAMLVNMDMIGQVHLEKGSRKDVFKWASNDAFAKSVLDAASKKALRPDERGFDGYPEQPQEGQFFTTDAEPLYRLNVPVLNFLSGRDLDNHAVEDDGGRIIPERMTQYARLIHACVDEAANRPASLAEMGIRPGVAKADYELIKARKTTGTRTIDEEKMRLSGLASRLPELREAALDVVEKARAPEIAEKTGVELAKAVSEPALAELREAHAEAADAFRDLPKDDPARAPAQARMAALAGLVDVVSAAVFLSKLDKKGDYYLGRIPEVLADLDRGAARLGLEAGLEGVVRESDIEAFLPEVSADRAVSVARDALSELGHAAGRAVRALLDPEAAVDDPRLVNEGDLERAGRALLERLGPVGPDERKLASFEALAESQLSGLRGGGEKWLARFRAKNALTDFGAAAKLIDPEDRALAEAAKKLGGAVESGEGLEPALTGFWSLAAESALGGRVELPAGVDGLKELGHPSRRKALVEAHLARALQAEVAAADPAAAKGVQDRRALVEAALVLQSHFAPKSGALLEGASLADVHAALARAADTAGHLDEGAPIAEELEFWKSWLTPYLELEGPGLLQAEARFAAAEEGLRALKPLWSRVAGGLAKTAGLDEATLASPAKTQKALQNMAQGELQHASARGLAKAALKQVRPYVEAEQALRTSTRTRSPRALAALPGALDALALVVGEPALSGARSAVAKLTREPGGPTAQIGRTGARSGPVRLLEIRR